LSKLSVGKREECESENWFYMKWYLYYMIIWIYICIL
jgi:hypothetical protein